SARSSAASWASHAADSSRKGTREDGIGEASFGVYSVPVKRVTTGGDNWLDFALADAGLGCTFDGHPMWSVCYAETVCRARARRRTCGVRRWGPRRNRTQRPDERRGRRVCAREGERECDARRLFPELRR